MRTMSLRDARDEAHFMNGAFDAMILQGASPDEALVRAQEMLTLATARRDDPSKKGRRIECSAER